MPFPPELLLTPVVVGANPRSSSLAVRDKLFVDEGDVAGMLACLRETGVAEALVLSTCDRVEVLAVSDDPEHAARSIAGVLARRSGVPDEILRQHLFVLSGVDAVRHVFSVAASLDSTVIGEPHVLGQVKDGLEAARQAGTVGSALENLMQAAFAVAKRIRTQTAIGARPVSVAAVAHDLACGIHGALDRCIGLVLGGGELGEVIVRNLAAAGLARLIAMDPRPSRAESLARLLNCNTLPYADLARALADADIVIAALSARQAPITADMVRQALRARRGRPMFFVDTGVPGDIEPTVERFESAFLYDLDDLERVARTSRRYRESEADAARRIIDADVAQFVQRQAQRAAGPTLRALKLHLDAMRRSALADAGGDADRATRLLVNRLLHGPVRLLQDVAGRGPAAATELAHIERLLLDLFNAPHDRREDNE